MQYFLRISFIVALFVLSVFTTKAQENPDTLAARLAMRLPELTELSTIAAKYRSVDSFLSYTVSIDIADSAAPTVVLQHVDGQYKMMDEMFWGLEDTTEYVQGQQYSIMVDHSFQTIYVYNKPGFTRAINLPITDSALNAGALKDLSVSRPGGVYKKLTIQYMPDADVKRLEVVYDSTNYVLKSVAYYYNMTYFSPNYFICQTLSDTLSYPSKGVAKPSSVANADIIKAYTNFIAEFPGHVNGATVRIYVESTGGSEMMSAPMMMQRQMMISAPLPDTAQPATQTNFMPAQNGPVNVQTDLIATDFSSTGTWVDSLMGPTQLFEWYMGTHLNLTGYTYENYADWLINTCNYKLAQLPWDSTVYVRQDTLQNIWNRFTAKYPVSQLTISETVNVPIKNGTIIGSNLSAEQPTDNVIYAFTWTNGGWFTERSANTFDLATLPNNATISSANLALYAYNTLGTFAANYRSISQYPYLQMQQVKGVYIPNQTSFTTQPDIYSGSPVINYPALSTGQVSSGNSSDFWSNQSYPSQNVTSLVSFMYNNVKGTGINYPVQYMLNDESSSYKLLQFGGGACSDPTKKAALTISYSAARQDVFTAFVNNALGTNMSFADVQQIYNLYGRLTVNSNATSTTASQGCDVEVGKPITAIKTVNFSNVSTAEFDPAIFGESRFINKVGDNFVAQPPFDSYKVMPVVH
jgi:hypothetical protein